MPLNYTVGSLDTIAPEHQCLYVEREGTFYLDVDADEMLAVHASGLKKALETERANNKLIKALGRAPSELAALIADAETVSEKLAAMDTTVQQREASWALEKAELESKIATSKKSEIGIIRDVLLETGLDRAKATAEGKSLLKDMLADRVRLDVDGENRTLTILTEDGAPKLNAAGKPATFADLVADSIKAYPSMFEGTGAGGGGKQPNGGARTNRERVLSRGEFNALSPREQASKMSEGWDLTD